MDDRGEASSDPEVEAISARIRRSRLMRGWTLEGLASRASLSKSYISRLEDGERQPSIAALLSISRALGLSLDALIGGEPQKRAGVRVVRGVETPAVAGNGLFYQVHSGSIPNAVMQPIRITVPSQRTGDELYRHDGEEWLYVLSGHLSLTLGEEAYSLGPGDSIYFDATAPHRLAASGGRDVEALLVASVAPRALLSSYL